MYPTKKEDAVKTHQKRILVVDDNPAMRELIAETVKALGYDVSAVGDGMKAINSIRSGLKVDAVITDYNVPVMNGEELTRRIKQNHPGIKVIFTSVADVEDFREVAEAAKADEVVSKMNIVPELPAILENLIGPADPFEMIARK